MLITYILSQRQGGSHPFAGTWAPCTPRAPFQVHWLHGPHPRAQCACQPIAAMIDGPIIAAPRMHVFGLGQAAAQSPKWGAP